MKCLYLTLLAMVFAMISTCKHAPSEVELDQSYFERFEIDRDRFGLRDGKGLESEVTTTCQFHLDREQWMEFQKHTEEKGFSSWQKGGVNFGHLNIGGAVEEQIYYSKRPQEGSGKDLILCYDKEAQTLYFILFGY
ncbi:hypothetical protein SAMN02745181_0435 [Rubritalea squalenifaciens DSM 18772]|uniref:Lipoprotein n=1 Tax=Rubritalea squalenifaciens DSM 18772 TaxID=1123071 RepID=A0A1M6CAW9_9BACT|nr:hypothetical protein [Rubritalea squalenifaciens]SHI58180.1 hypothetical protein SAMN02745181_0435 [Rubritalea squalenifaciens DSM 18772]